MRKASSTLLAVLDDSQRRIKLKLNSIAILLLLTVHTTALAADAETDTHLRKGLAQAISSLPMQVDKRTTLVSLMLLPGHVLSYRYSLDLNGMIDDAAAQANLSRAQLLQRLQQKSGNDWLKLWADQYIFPLIVKSGCSQPFTQSILKLGYTINHTMTNTDGTYLFERFITRKDCNF